MSQNEGSCKLPGIPGKSYTTLLRFAAASLNLRQSGEDGVTYDVIFDFCVEIVDEKNVDNMIKNSTVEDNFYYVDSGKGGSYGFNSDDGGNIAYLATEEVDEEGGTTSHELNHGFGGINHPNPNAERPENGEKMGIEYPHNHQYSDDTPINTKDRKVNQEDIEFILRKVKFNEKGEGDAGVNNTINKTTGNHGYVPVE